MNRKTITFILTCLCCSVLLSGGRMLAIAAPQGTTAADYFPIRKDTKWEYQVDFPTNTSLPYLPTYEYPPGLICSSLHCGMGSWNAGQIDFQMTVSDIVEKSSSTTTWGLSLTGLGLRFYFYQTDTVGNQNRLRLKLESGNADLDLVTVTPVGAPNNWRISRTLARLTPNDLGTKFDIAVPAGEFRNCVKSVVTIQGDGTYVPTGSFPIEIFLAPNVGIIKAIGRWSSGETLYTSQLTKFTPGAVVKVSDEFLPLVKEYALHQNYPNPFNPTTSIEFALPKSTFVTLQICDVLGRQVAQLVNEKFEAGTYKTQWDARGLASGVYFYRIVAGSFLETKKMLLIR